MSFTLVDSHLLEHPKFATLDDAALALWLRGLVFANRYRTDGLLDRGTLVTIRARPKIVRELVARRIWEPLSSGAYRIHDFLDYNFDREGRKPPRPVPTQLRPVPPAVPPDLREQRAAAGREGARRRWGEGNGKSGDDDGKTVANDMANLPSNDGKSGGFRYSGSQDLNTNKSGARPNSFAKPGDFLKPLLDVLKKSEADR